MTARSTTAENLAAIALELRALILQVNDVDQRLQVMAELHGHQLAEILDALHFKPKEEGAK